MVRRIHKVGVIVVTIALVSLALGVNQLLATDLSMNKQRKSMQSLRKRSRI